MTENRCPDCESLMFELDCAECLQYLKASANLQIMIERLADLPAFKTTHCPKGHEYTEANTRIDLRPGSLKSPIRACRTCHNQRLKIARARRRAETTQPRESGGLDRGRAAPTGRMTPQTLPVEGTT